MTSSTPKRREIQDQGENFVQWANLTLHFFSPHLRAGDHVEAPIELLVDADDVAPGGIAAVQMDAAQARAAGTGLVRFAARLDAENGTAPQEDRVVALENALAVALDALGRAALVCANQSRVGRDAPTLERIARELFDSHAKARRVAGMPPSRAG